MDALDLRSAVAIAAETMDRAGEFYKGCPEGSEISVLYANGRRSGVQRIWRGRSETLDLALLANGAPPS